MTIANTNNTYPYILDWLNVSRFSYAFANISKESLPWEMIEYPVVWQSTDPLGGDRLALSWSPRPRPAKPTFKIKNTFKRSEYWLGYQCGDASYFKWESISGNVLEVWDELYLVGCNGLTDGVHKFWGLITEIDDLDSPCHYRDFLDHLQ